jgi:hypothetical protein
MFSRPGSELIEWLAVPGVLFNTRYIGGELSYIIPVFALLSVSVLAAQDSALPAWVDQLKPQYKLVKLSQDSNGISVVQPGTVLVLQKAGILGVPPLNVVMCPAKYKDGELHAPGGFCAGMVKQTSRYFQSGEKVYLFKIDVNVKKEQISVRIVACDSCNGTDPPTFFKSEVQFEFPKGYLETATTAQVQDTVNQVMTIDGGDAKQSPGPPAGAVGSPVAPAPPAPIAPPPPPADQPPQTIEIGQTVDQVVAALGQPQKIAKVGTKQIYFYKDLKVTFNDGKVSDVE